MIMSDRFRGFLPIVVDIETGGFSPNEHAILELAAVFLRLDDDGVKIAGSWQRPVAPRAGSRVEEASLKVTGIDPTRPAPSEEEAIRELIEVVRRVQRDADCQRSLMVAHNAAFDMGFFNAAVERAGIKRNPFHPFTFIDTASLAAVAVGHTVLRESCVRAGIAFESERAHGALYDAERTAELFCWIVNRWDGSGELPMALGDAEP
ncbi:MAG: exonuclease domain-containing protein [Pseudomonadota bacterium]